ncbi:hypothetical protein K7395_24730 [Streptomyces filamentosus]|uniref:Uncharacterized protein n=1 Tax=Streptomyces filamentosus TaxID=67294 RepID=A0ABY4UZL6_STRFL|nr:MULTISPECIES: hypothetical protein [Streptomyces]EWS91672.1 hypothetical protein SSIG_07265 [Streptomyces filamentosus NRRL 11379]MYR78701.1 hypothetical protein [Streptomyces sp. SID5466]USC49695.1 hypothetical protein K7395_24730 [Streptomyces filamentosus]
MAAFATVEDYEKRAAVTLPAGSPRRAQVEVYLDDASALMRGKIPAGFTPPEETTRAIAVAVTRRVIANGGGYRQRTIGQYSETLGEAGGLYLTEDEIDQLQPEDDTDPDADAAYSVELLDRSPHGWRDDPADFCRRLL